MQAVIDFPGSGASRCRFAFRQPQEILLTHRLDAVADVIAAAQDQARRGAWVLGFVAYEAAPAFDRAMLVQAPTGALPLACFAAFARTFPDSDRGDSQPVVTGPWQSLTERHVVFERIAAIRAAIARGEVYQVNLSTRLRADFHGNARHFFGALRRAQPDGYGIYLDAGTWKLLSVSPELFFDWTADGLLTARPMKGTAARDPDPTRDGEAMERMLASPKERAENLMIVDLLRNDMSRIAQIGSVRVPRMFDVEALPTAWQMTSTIQCRTDAGIGLPEIFHALFPCGSVTGAPKIAAMAAIRNLEPAPRGAYCGAIGLIRPGGHATFNVGIRTVMIDTAKCQAECGIGSGITLDSTEEGEFAEWQVKQRFLFQASRLQ